MLIFIVGLFIGNLFGMIIMGLLASRDVDRSEVVHGQ